VAFLALFWRLNRLNNWRFLFIENLASFIYSFEDFNLVFFILLMLFGDEFSLFGGFFC
jgi:hypothetical protein